MDTVYCGDVTLVSTHSRPKAAGSGGRGKMGVYLVSTHSRPKAAGRWSRTWVGLRRCFNSQPPEGGWVADAHGAEPAVEFQLTAARRRLGFELYPYQAVGQFQLTAARRRLGKARQLYRQMEKVSTHSRPKAAGRGRYRAASLKMFQLTAARRRLGV